MSASIGRGGRGPTSVNSIQRNPQGWDVPRSTPAWPPNATHLARASYGERRRQNRLRKGLGKSGALETQRPCWRPRREKGKKKTRAQEEQQINTNDGLQLVWRKHSGRRFAGRRWGSTAISTGPSGEPQGESRSIGCWQWAHKAWSGRQALREHHWREILTQAFGGRSLIASPVRRAYHMRREADATAPSLSAVSRRAKKRTGAKEADHSRGLRRRSRPPASKGKKRPALPQQAVSALKCDSSPDSLHSSSVSRYSCIQRLCLAQPTRNGELM